MGVLVSDADLAYLQSVYPLAGIEALTTQEEQFLMYHLKGQSIRAAEEAVGMSRGKGRKTLDKPGVETIIEYVREKEFKDIRITRETLTSMLLEAHAKGANATEEIMAIRELGRMYDLYEDAKHKGNTTNVLIDKRVQNIKQIERASDEELMKIAGETISLDPDDYKVVDDGHD